jgi:alkanesulfonate monooxygenase SsuD/methylene tetrahydromethanopterin reductase-like flavin-dependent oxidoreductase (luciferase family)
VASSGAPLRVGVALPSFRDTVQPALDVADVAEEAGIDGIFVYDHLFRRALDGTRRPAIEMSALLGAVAARTERVVIGSLVARATLRPPAVLASLFATAARIAGDGRVVCGIGSGDTHSREENETFGLPFGAADDRVAALRAAVDAVRARGIEVWVGGHDARVHTVAAEAADGWNAWGLDVERFARVVTTMQARARHRPFACTWGGLVVLDADDDAAAAKARRLGVGPGTVVGGPSTVAAALRAYAERGAAWVVVGFVDSSDPGNARRLGEEVLPRLR